MCYTIINIFSKNKQRFEKARWNANAAKTVQGTKEKQHISKGFFHHQPNKIGRATFNHHVDSQANKK